MVVVKPVKYIKVPVSLYRAVRSFTESSVKPSYPHNQGIFLPKEKVVVFTKPGKWIFGIFLPENIGSAVLKSWDRRYDIVYDYEENIIEVNATRVLDDEKHFAAIIPDAEVPFAIPVLLRDLIFKFERYIEDTLKQVQQLQQRSGGARYEYETG